ncbi:14224_t:CDS:2 [Acaulospora morrowiae]|uniref:14224_t:CDS:1 n=1 Tax=Acaulospora morrowiae TaxID=94023 RepID=A0A9N9BDA9_9GLOM|nr:14224_t:CDS:2 [Acaulospora morrowiae]
MIIDSNSFALYDIFIFLLSSVTFYLSYLVLRYYYIYFTRPNPLPGPFPLPLVGCLFLDGFNFYRYSIEQHKKHGDIFEVWYGDIRIIILSDINFTEPMTTQSFNKSNYKVRFPPVEGLKELGIFGKGILINHDVKSWKFNRSIFAQALLVPKFLKQVVDLTKLHFQELDEYWKSFDGNDGVIQLVDWVHRFNTDFIFHITTGKRYYSLASYYSSIFSSTNIAHEKSPENQKYLLNVSPEFIEESEKLLSCINSYLVAVNFFCLFPKFLRAIPFLRNKQKKMIKKKEWLFEKLTEFIKKRRKEIEEIPDGEELNYDMLTMMITANTKRDIYVVKKNMEKKLENEQRPLSDEEIVVNLTEAFVGGIETTANTICFIVYHLSRHPEVRRRLLEELDTVFGANMTNFSLTYEDIQKLVYCEAVIKETARIDTVAPFLDRQSTNADVIANRSWGPKTQFSMSIGRIHKKPEYWENPDQFNPDRFLPENVGAINKNTFLQFGTGLRYCPGQKVAMTEMKCLIALLYKNYDIELVDANAPLKVSYTLIQKCLDLKIKVKRRNE